MPGLPERIAQLEQETEALRSELASARGLVAALLRGASDYATIESDSDGRITFWNEGAQALTGWTEGLKTKKPVSPNGSGATPPPMVNPTTSDGTCARTARGSSPTSV